MYWNLKNNILDQLRIQGEGQGWLVTHCKRIEKSCAPFSFLGYEFSNSKCDVKYEVWVLSQSVYKKWICKTKWPKCSGCLEYMSVRVRFQSSCALVHWVTEYPSAFRRPECLNCLSVRVPWVSKCPSNTLWVIFKYLPSEKGLHYY